MLEQQGTGDELPMPSQVKAVFFDLGETLYTYEGIPLSWRDHYSAAWLSVLAEIGGLDRADQLDFVVDHMGRYDTRRNPREQEYDSQKIFSEALEILGSEPDHTHLAANTFFKYFRTALRPYPEASGVLQELRRRGIRTGALTDVAYGMPREFVVDDLDRCGLRDLIEILYTSVDVGFRKPCARGFGLLCEATGVLPSQAIYVGNEQKDVAGASAAGMWSVLIARGTREVPRWGQDYSIESLSDILPLAGGKSGDVSKEHAADVYNHRP